MIFGNVKAQTKNIHSMEPKWKGKPIPKKEVQLILFQNKYENVSVRYVSHMLPGEQFFLIDDNRFVLQFPSGNGVLYPSVKDFLETLVEPHKTFFPIITSDFDERIPKLINTLSEMLGLKLEESDRLEKLEEVDSKLREKGWTKLNSDDLTLPLSAYCAQVLKNELNGTINIENDSNNDYKVIVTGINGNRFNPYIIVTGEFMDVPSNISFSGLIKEIVYPSTFLKV